MKKSAFIIPVIIGGAALLLIAAATKSEWVVQPHPYTAASWLAAIMAFGVSVVMLAEHFLHKRQIHLYIGTAFLSLGILGVWEALTLPSAIVNPEDNTYIALWQAGWITLALMLVFGIILNREAGSKPSAMRTATVASVGILWAALIIFPVSVFPAAADFLAMGRIGFFTSITCGAVLAVAFAAYIRSAVNKGNAVLAWMGYGLVFAVFAQAAIVLQTQPYGALFGFASLMKVLAFLSPLAGMLAEHTRLQLRLHDQASDMSSLIQTQHAISSFTMQAEVYQRIVELISVSCEAAAVCLMTFDKERGLLNVAARVGFDDDQARRLAFRPSEGPPGDCFSNKEPIFIKDVFKNPTLLQKLDGVGTLRSGLFMPLIVREECLGVLALFFGGRPIQRMSKEQMRVVDALAEQAALAVDGFQLRGRIDDTARTSDDYARELEIVWEIGQAIAAKLELHALVDTLAGKLSVAVGAKTCSVLVFEPDVVGLNVLGHRQLVRYRSVADHTDQCDIIAAAVAQKGEPVIANDVPNSGQCKYPDMAVDDGGTHHILSVPMSALGFVGAITVFRQNADAFGEREKRLLVRLAPMVAAGVRNADLYEREKKIAESLEASFMPDFDREYPDIRIDHGYLAAFDESLVGGDFYDVIEFGEGKYGIAIGDVAGKGLDAAVFTAMTRYMIQAYSDDDLDPVGVVSKLNSALYRYTPTGKFVTLVYGVLDTMSGSFTYVNAGHEIPFIRKSGDRLESLQTTGPAAGALAEADYTSDTVPFEPGDMIIFYTDGATEARCEGKFLGTEGLRKIITDQLRRNMDNLAKAILSGVRSYAKGHLRDDIAVLVVKARTPGALF